METITKTRSRKTHTKSIRNGLSLYKTNRSPYWNARIWVSGEKKYVVRSTKETSRVDAIEAAEEILNKLKKERFVDGVPPNRQFQHYANILINEQKKVVGKERGKRFSQDDEDKLNRKGDGILQHFGKMDVAIITTSHLREYLNS